jgi:hypothetical protein
MEPEVSIPNSQELSTCSYHEAKITICCLLKRWEGLFVKEIDTTQSTFLITISCTFISRHIFDVAIYNGTQVNTISDSGV